MRIYYLDILVWISYNTCMMTINISLPKSMYEDMKRFMKTKRYASVSEVIREALRDRLYPELTENGFTPEFEEFVLQAEKEPIFKSRTWNGKGSFTDFVLNEQTSSKKTTS